MVAPRLRLGAIVSIIGIVASAPPAGAQTPLPVAPAEPVAVPAVNVLEATVVEAAPAPVLPPYGGPFFERSKLSGDWFGARSALRDNGVTFDVSSTQFYQGVLDGGLDKTFQYGGRLDYLMHIDGQKAGLWAGLFVDLHAETRYGNSTNAAAGTLLPTNFGLAVPRPNGEITALTGVKVTQALSENFVLFAGKINTLDGFIQPFAGGRGVDAFQNTAFLFNPVLARTIPYSTLGGGAAYLVDGQPVASLLVLDPTDSTTSSGFDTFFTRGAVVLGAVNVPTHLFGLPGHQGVGFSYSTASYASLDGSAFTRIVDLVTAGVPLKRKETGSWSMFYAFDQALASSSNDPSRTWGVFGNLGLADGNPSPFRWFGSIGFGGASPIRNRPLDTFGVGYFYLGLSEDIVDFAPRVLPLGDEHGVELFYNAAITPWFHLTPDVQIINSARPRADSPFLFGLRAKIDF